MTISKTNSRGYSSQVQIDLEFNGHAFPVAQVGEDSLILQEELDIIPGTNARLLITIDGRTKAYPIVIDSVVPQHTRTIVFSDWTALSTVIKEHDDLPF